MIPSKQQQQQLANTNSLGSRSGHLRGGGGGGRDLMNRVGTSGREVKRYQPNRIRRSTSSNINNNNNSNMNRSSHSSSSSNHSIQSVNGTITTKNNNNNNSNSNSSHVVHVNRNNTIPSLEMTLREWGCYDDKNEIKRRTSLDSLEKILHQWSLGLLRERNERPNNAWTIIPHGVALICFGSYRLGVHRPSSDMDVLALCPPHCTRADFFTYLVDRLRRDNRVTDLHPIPSAYTPVIKFVLQNVHIDLLFARLQNATKLVRYQQQQQQPSLLALQFEEHNSNSNNSNNNNYSNSIKTTPRIEYSIDDTDLVGLDEAGVRSINGSRVSQFLLQLVPNVETFRMVLRAVKGWSGIHGVQSNVLGFLGGINWAILVARVAVDNPDASPSELLLIFFRTFSQWKWPEPVTLGPICDEPPSGVPPMPAWNPKVEPRDGWHLMPIITPVFPSMNSAYNIGIPQLRRITDEMCRAAVTLETAPHPGDCSGIFQDGGFFRRHSNYLQIHIRACSREDFVHWHRYIESRLRLLIASLETQETQVWPFANFFDRRYGNNNHESFFFIGIRFAQGVETVDMRYSTSEFLHKVNQWEGRTDTMDLSIARVSDKDLPPFVTGEIKTNASQQRGRPAAEVASATTTTCPQMVPWGAGHHGIGGLASPPKRARKVL